MVAAMVGVTVTEDTRDIKARTEAEVDVKDVNVAREAETEEDMAAVMMAVTGMALLAATEEADMVSAMEEANMVAAIEVVLVGAT